MTTITYGPWQGHLNKGLAPVELGYVLRIACGLTDKQIARERGLSPSGVKSRLRNTAFKLGAHRRAEMVAEAIRRGIVAPLSVLLALMIATAPACDQIKGRHHRAPVRVAAVRATSKTEATA